MIQKGVDMNAIKSDGVKLEEAPDGAIPKCPFCKANLDTLWIKKKGLGVLEQKQIIMCPQCESFGGYGVFGSR